MCALHPEASVTITITFDDELLLKASSLTGLIDRSALVREALKALIERESARRLARLGGSEPKRMPIPRRRPAESTLEDFG